MLIFLKVILSVLLNTTSAYLLVVESKIIKNNVLKILLLIPPISLIVFIIYCLYILGTLIKNLAINYFSEKEDIFKDL